MAMARSPSAPKKSGLLGEVGGLNIITTDYNNDGRPDIVVLRGGWLGNNGHYPLSLLRNDGKGHFTDVTLSGGTALLRSDADRCGVRLQR